MHPVDKDQEVKRYIQVLMGIVTALAGFGLLGFTVVLVYADFIRDLPSRVVVTLILITGSAGGIFCSLVGIRLISGKKTVADKFLLSPMAWKMTGIIFFILSLLLVVRGKLLLAIPVFAFGILCLIASRSITYKPR